jgi:hypothetical protein
MLLPMAPQQQWLQQYLQQHPGVLGHEILDLLQRVRRVPLLGVHQEYELLDRTVPLFVRPETLWWQLLNIER